MRNVKSKIKNDLSIWKNNIFTAKETEKIVVFKPTLNG